MSRDLSPQVSPPKAIRWWPVVTVLVLAIGAVFWVHFGYDKQRQDKNIAVALIAIISLALLLLWCLFFSRLSWKIRWLVLAGTIAIILLTPVFFRIRGVTGDLVPIPEWRWKQRSPAALISGHTVENSPIDVPNERNKYPQFLGPHRNATVESPRLARDWKASPPLNLWRHPVGPGWSGFSIDGNHAVTQEQNGEEETIRCYDLISGALVWSHGYAAHFQSSLAGEGPRATPTVVGRRVYAEGSTGILTCLDLGTGKLIWTKDIVSDNKSKVNEWGMSCSPLVTGDQVIVSAGGRDNRSLVAYRAATGEFAWGGGNEGAGYSSPLETTLAGLQQIVIFNSGGIFGHSPLDGKVLWHYPWPGGHPHVSIPVVLPEDRVLVSSGYGVGSEVFSVKRDAQGSFTATRVWKSNRLKAKFTNVVYRNGFIYGLDDGIFVCINADDGELKWKEGRYGHGQEILAGELVLVMAESGDVVLLEPDPQGLRELTRFSAFRDKTWNPPAIAGEYLLVRNDKEAACFRLPVVK